MEKQPEVNSNQSIGIEPNESAATPRLAPREAAEVSDNAVFISSSELNDVMEFIGKTHEVQKIEELQLINPEEIDFENLEAAAAGASGGSSGEGNGFVRLLRIAEGVSPLSYDYRFEANDEPEPLLLAAQGEEIVPVPDEIIQPPPEDDPRKEPDDQKDPEQDDEEDPPKDDEDEDPDEEDPEEPEQPEEPEDPQDPEEPDDPDEEDPVDPEEPPEDPPEEPEDPDDKEPGGPRGNNGWGNGDQDAPGNSQDNNQAENSDRPNPLEKDKGKLNPKDLLDDDVSSGNQSDYSANLEFNLLLNLGGKGVRFNQETD